MRLLVPEGALGPEDRRMHQAVLGLAARGHVVHWLDTAPGEPLPPWVHVGGTGAHRLRGAVDLVVGASGRLSRAVGAGWLAGAHGVLVSSDPVRMRREGFVERWFAGSVPALRLLEDAATEVERAADAAEGDESDRIEHWSAEPVPESADPCHPDTERLERAAERLLARRAGHAPRPAVFVDRDGTLVVEKGYLADAADIELLPGTVAGLRRAHAAGMAVVVVSNQSGVGRGFFPLGRVYEAMARLRVELRASGIELDAVYFCPHRPDAGCACRKPGGELLLRATHDLHLLPRRSVMIGDKLLDVATGHGVGAAGILVRTGYGRDEERRLEGSPADRRPDHVAEDVADAVGWWIANGSGAHE